MRIIFLAVMLLSVGFNVNAAGYDFKVDGIYYNILSSDDRTVEVTNKYGGESLAYSYSGSVTIPQKVIGNSITYTVTAIGSNAFDDCSVTSIELPSSVTSIGYRAFGSCSSLTSVEMPNVTSIGEWAFWGFGDNSSLTSVEMPNVTSIGDCAFRDCSKLTSVKMPNVTSIGGGAFWDCSSLTSVELPSSVTSIEDFAFVGCSSLTTINVDEDNQTYASVNGVVYTKDMTELCVCPGGKTSVSIPNTVTTIRRYAFYGCSSLASVELPSSVTSIGDKAFYGCNSLIDVFCESTTPPSATNGVFSDKTLQYGTLYVPVGSKGDYESVDPWRNFWNIKEMEFSGVVNVIAESNDITVTTVGGTIVVGGLEAGSIVEVYSINGQLAYHGTDNVIGNLGRGAYIVKAGSKTVKILL